jgi:hypothetical protein
MKSDFNLACGTQTRHAMLKDNIGVSAYKSVLELAGKLVGVN